MDHSNGCLLSDAVTSRLERLVARLSRFVKGKGVVIKTRNSLTTFGEGLDDAEIRYLELTNLRIYELTNRVPETS